ncbi:glycerophosphodiester phosphodiesterase family protein [Pedobacter sp. SYSU D00535]|uniref:glycerophosphodiester phosphodiesterase family protein n=1 Tax=Pedobacter sp. SYSU D00535 TaxID=2810308 RepID=UPI001A9666F9|nr:glycerophosphodiester phosphodiesterase family protein [Pedobacter sp. SYSU D00535]
MKNLAILLITILGFLKVLPAQENRNLDIQAHQGGCGLYPCNTIPAFINALKLGVTTLELDVVISEDQQMVVSHDQFMSHRSMLTPSGDSIAKAEELRHNLYKMPYSAIRKYDAGLKYWAEFPRQQKLSSYKPLLSELIDSVESFCKNHKLKEARYNIEIKSLKGDGIYHPAPEAFTELVLKVVRDKKMEDRVIIQSFDVRALQHLHQSHPGIKTSFLIGNKEPLGRNLEKLGFIPDILSPHYKLLNEKLMQEARQHHMLVIPWTIDEAEEMKRIVQLGVDGIITNYPDLALKLFKDNKY